MNASDRFRLRIVCGLASIATNLGDGHSEGLVTDLRSHLWMGREEACRGAGRRPTLAPLHGLRIEANSLWVLFPVGRARMAP